MARRCPLLAICAAVCLLAPQLSAATWASQKGQLSQEQRGEILKAVRRQLLEDQEDLRQNLEARSTRRLQEADATVPLGTGLPYTVGLPVVGSLGTVIAKLTDLVDNSSVVGHYPFDSFPGLGNSSNRWGFAPTNESFCLFASNSKAANPADCNAAFASALHPAPGIPNHAGSAIPYYNGNYNGYGSYGHYNVIDLRGPAPSDTFPYGLPPQLANLLNVLGADLHCLLGPNLPASAPPFPVFLEVLLEDATAVTSQFMKLLSGDLSSSSPLNSDLLLLRDPYNPWGTPLKFEFSLSQNLDLSALEAKIPYPPTSPAAPAPDVNPGVSPVAATIPPGNYIRAVAYDGYLDSCQVILGTQPGSDGTFDKVNDFAGSITDGAWSVDLSALVNNTGDAAYVVPAARSNNYGQLSLADRKSAGYCYDIATLLPVYNPLAVPIPEDIDINNHSLAASALTTVLVFGHAYGLDEPGLKTAFGIDQMYNLALWDALDATLNDPWGPGAHMYRENIKVQNTVTLGANLMTNDSSTYASFSVLLYQAVARAAVGATNVAAADNFKNLNGPALNLDSATSIQDIYYGAKAWVGTTSDPTLPSAVNNADARVIYAVALAANNINAAADHAENATDIQKTAYYTQAVIVPQLEEVLTGESSVDEFMALTTYDALEQALANTELPGSLTVPPAVAPVVPVTADTTTQSASQSNRGSSGLSGGAIAGIVIGCVVGAGLIAAAAAFTAKQLRARHSTAGSV